MPPTNIGRSDLDPFYFDPLGGGGLLNSLKKIKQNTKLFLF